MPRLRAEAADGSKVLVGETAPVGRPGTVMGPIRFLRRWLCLDAAFQPLAGAAAAREGCSAVEKIDADGFAHHPYGPAQRVFPRRDVINLLAIKRLGGYLDRAAQAGRLPSDLPIYSTEFGLQSNPPDPTVSTTLAQQAQILNEKEVFSFRYPRLRSYSQYLLYDDPPRPGASPEEVWSGFQTGLRFTDGRAKPALNAYRLPIVVTPATAGVAIWGRVRPGSGVRSVQLELRDGARFVAAGKRVDYRRSGLLPGQPLGERDLPLRGLRRQRPELGPDWRQPGCPPCGSAGPALAPGASRPQGRRVGIVLGRALRISARKTLAPASR